MNIIETSKKLKENQERRFRENLLGTLPDSFCDLIRNSPYHYSEEYFKLIQISPWPNYKEGELITKNDFAIYIHLEMDDIKDIKQIITESKFDFEGELYIWFGAGPVFEIENRLDVKDLSQIIDMYDENKWECIYISKGYGRKGILIDSYGGHLPPHRCTNTFERVLEFVYFEK